MITTVLGAAGSGKSSVVRPLFALLPTHVILDWDAFMIPAAALAGREIRQNPDTWSAYRELVRAVVESVARIPVVLLGVCTPDELHGWPITGCVLLDCTDDERQRRLSSDARFDDIEAALVDGRGYRTLGLPVVDTTGRTPSEVAADLARFVHRMDAG